MDNDETNRSPKSRRLKPKIGNFIRKAKDGTSDLAHMVIRRKDDREREELSSGATASVERRRNTSPARPVGSRSSSSSKSSDGTNSKVRNIHTNKPISTLHRKEKDSTFVPKPLRKVSSETIAKLREKREKERELDDEMAPTEFERVAAPMLPANPDAKRKVSLPKVQTIDEEAHGTREFPSTRPKPSRRSETSVSKSKSKPTKEKVHTPTPTPSVKGKVRAERIPKVVPDDNDVTVFERIDAPLMPANPDAKVKVPALAPKAIMCPPPEDESQMAASSAEVINSKENLSREEVKQETAPKTAVESQMDVPTAKGGVDFSLLVDVKSEPEQKKTEAEKPKYVYEKTFVKDGKGNLIPRWVPVLQKGPKETGAFPYPDRNTSAEEHTAVPRSKEELPEAAKSVYVTNNSSCVVS